MKTNKINPVLSLGKRRISRFDSTELIVYQNGIKSNGVCGAGATLGKTTKPEGPDHNGAVVFEAKH